MSRLERAREFRNRINANLQATRKLIRIDELSEEELVKLIDLYEDFDKKSYEYKKGDVFKFDNQLYEVIQTHISQDDWVPSELPALYKLRTPDNIIPDWVQPAGAHDAYNKGDRVIFEGIVRESTMNGNVWSPTEYPDAWKIPDD